MKKMELDELTANAPYVVIGKVKDMHSEWDAGHQNIYTFVTIKIEEIVKGTISDTDEIVVRHLGGEVGKIGLMVSDTPKFKKNEKVMVFLEKKPDGIFEVTGWFQGKYTVKDDKIVEKGISLNEFKEKIKKLDSEQKKK